MRGKRGQFYIIAAVIIAIIILSITGLTNYVTVKEEPASFYDLGTNFGQEGPVVVNYGVYNSLVISDVVKRFTDAYSDYMALTGEQEFNLVVIYGNNRQATKTTYTRASTGEVETDLGTIPVSNAITSVTEPIPTGQSSIDVRIQEKDYNFKLKENENFLFVMTTSKGFENYVEENIQTS